jgi:hypothetical protein
MKTLGCTNEKIYPQKILMILTNLQCMYVIKIVMISPLEITNVAIETKAFDQSPFTKQSSNQERM